MYIQNGGVKMPSPFKYRGELDRSGLEKPPVEVEKEEEPKTLLDLLMEVIKAREQEGKTRLAEAVE